MLLQLRLHRCRRRDDKWKMCFTQKTAALLVCGLARKRGGKRCYMACNHNAEAFSTLRISTATGIAGGRADAGPLFRTGGRDGK